VEKKLVRFLNSGGGIACDQKIDIRKANGRSTVASEKCNGLEFTRFRFF